jgi:hypothetical protein
MYVAAHYQDEFPWNGQEINIFLCVASMCCYIGCGLYYGPDEGGKLVERLEAGCAADIQAAASGEK